MATIRDHIVFSLNAFQCLTEVISMVTLDDGTENDTWPTESYVAKVKNLQARFKVWSGNIGAHRSGRSSLEYRLRDASNIREFVVKLLEDMVQSLQEATSIVQSGTNPWERVESTSSDSSDDDDESDINTNEPYSPESEFSQVIADVAEIVNCLFRLSITIKNPLPHDRFTHSVKGSFYEPFDVDHVKQKFPKAEQEIAERLGKAVSQRRQYFKYRESHHQKLARGLDNDEIDGESTVASSLPQHLKFTPATEATQVLEEDSKSVSGFSQTSFATSAATSNKRRIPDLPKEAHEGPFPCKYCHMVVSVDNYRSWKKHVYGDLRPYACLWKQCATAGEEYERRHHWMEHVLQSHWRVWNCVFGCAGKFDSVEDMRSHLKSEHPDAYSPNNIHVDTAIMLSERPRPLDSEIACLLCKDQLRSMKEYQKHVGRHLEDTFLFALPNIVEYEDRLEESEEGEVQYLETTYQASNNSENTRSGSDTSREAVAREEEQDQSPNSQGSSRAQDNVTTDESEYNDISHAVPKTQEGELRRRELEEKTQKDTEEVIARRMEEVRPAQEEAREEIEGAKKADREVLEAEHKAGDQTQTQFQEWQTRRAQERAKVMYPLRREQRARYHERKNAKDEAKHKDVEEATKNNSK